MTTTKHGRTVKRMLEDEGYEILDWHVGRHYRIRLRRAGVEFKLTVSISPSDHRVLHQIRTQLKQQYRVALSRSQSAC